MFSVAMSTFPSFEDREVVTLATPLHRIVLAERMGGEFLGQEDPPQIGMPVEADAEHVPDLALHPVRPLPEPHHRGDHRIGIVDEGPHGQPFAGFDRSQQIDQSVAMLGVAIVEIVDAGDVDQQIELALVLRNSRRRGEDK